MVLHPLPAFTDNYIWCLHDGRDALVVDPGESAGVMAWLAAEQLSLQAILITHHHPDHTGGVAALREATGASVYGPARETLPEPVLRVQAGEQVRALGLSFEVMDVPGHTAGHVAYFLPAAGHEQPLVFCGDTLFSGGCGRLFEGTPGQMLESLQRLSALPDSTRVCCTHEYTLANLAFAQAVEPDNRALSDYVQESRRRREENFPTLPSSIGLEKRINPFLRSDQPAIVQAVSHHHGSALTDPTAVFAALREWKNVYR